MAGKTSIEWTEQSWNPIVGCSIVSPGCTNCYAMKMARRLQAMADKPRWTKTGVGTAHYAGTTKVVNGNAVWTGKLALAPDHVLTAPLRRNKATTYFVNSMGDLFHEDCSDEWIDKVFAVMALTPQHTFQVLTKRAERMRAYVTRRDDRVRHASMTYAALMAATGRYDTPALDLRSWPLPNVWLGVSAEDQRRAEERVPLLLHTPAAIRFVSAEPLLGPIDFRKLMLDEHTWVDAITGYHSQQRGPGPVDQVLKEFTPLPPKTGRLHQIITGGESGPNARPMHPQWPRDIHKQCSILAAFFHKQNGEFASVSAVEGPGAHFTFPDGATVRRVGKKAAGRLLDGVEHNGFPSVQGRAV
jgi:protein gp37